MNTVENAFFPELPGYYRGKVRDNYTLGNERLMSSSTGSPARVPC